MLNKELINNLNLKDPSMWIATWFGCGLIKGAPGTWGTLGAIPFGFAILFYGNIYILAGFIFIFTLIGLWASDKFEKATGTHDASAIVIDEVVGLWITLIFAKLSITSFFLSFIFFRVFDITKPWPISWVDKNIKGAKGVMFDDIVAGFAAGLCIWSLHYYGFG